jgi:hypothetical protein
VELITADVFDRSNPYDEYLHSLIALDVGPSRAAEENVMAAGREPDRNARRTRADAKSHIAGSPITGKHYSPLNCPECETTLPWEPQCPNCTAAFEGRRAVSRAEAGVVGATSSAEPKHDPLRNTNSFEEFMARQFPLPLTDPSDLIGNALQRAKTAPEVRG